MNGPNSIAKAMIRDIVEMMLEKLGKETVFMNAYHVLYLPLMNDVEDEYRFYLEHMYIYR